MPPHPAAQKRPLVYTIAIRGTAAFLIAIAIFAWIAQTNETLSGTGLIGIGALVFGAIAITFTVLLFRALAQAGRPPAPQPIVRPQVATPGPPPGWYQRPELPGTHWWDGTRWTGHTQP